MAFSGLQERIKHGYHKFCDGTSMHGFTELYYTKSSFWLFLWCLAIGTALGLTTYQVIKAVAAFADQSTTTSMQLAKSEDMMFPPLQVCYPHWMYWVDWDKAISLGYTKGAVLYGLSYLTNIYSDSHFDVDKAKKELLAGLSRHKINTIDDFYRSIASDPTAFISIYEEYISLEFRPSGDWTTKLCVAINETAIKTIVGQGSTNKRSLQPNKLSFTVDYKELNDPPNNYINEKELDSYIQDWLNLEAMGLKAHGNVPNIDILLPMVVFPNKYDSNGIYLSSTMDIYSVSMSLSIQKWKSTPEKMCQSGIRHISTNDTCEAQCAIGILLDHNVFPITFFTGVIMNKTSVKDINYLFSIIFLNDMKIDSSSVTTTQSVDDTNRTESNITWSFQDLFQECTNQCANNAGCEIYDFYYTTSGSVLFDLTNNSTRDTGTKVRVVIQYPSSSNVLVMSELDGQTWEGFVGNVGGLLGIWTGASVLSFLQLVYLCCFTDSEFGCSTIFRTISRKEPRKERNINNNAVLFTTNSGNTEKSVEKLKKKKTSLK